MLRQLWSAELSNHNVASISAIHASVCSCSAFQIFFSNTNIDRGRTMSYFEVGTRENCRHAVIVPLISARMKIFIYWPRKVH
jgi:hypothetical protein